MIDVKTASSSEDPLEWKIRQVDQQVLLDSVELPTKTQHAHVSYIGGGVCRIFTPLNA